MLLISILSILLSTEVKADHAIYISVLEIDQEQMRIKVFMDDLDQAVTDSYHSVEGYFKEKVEIKVNDEYLDFKLLDIREEEDSYWITFQLSQSSKWNSFYMRADYLMELFTDQTNIVKILGEKTRFFKLTASNPSCSFSW